MRQKSTTSLQETYRYKFSLLVKICLKLLLRKTHLAFGTLLRVQIVCLATILCTLQRQLQEVSKNGKQ